MFRAASKLATLPSILKDQIGLNDMAKLNANRPSFSQIGREKFELLRGVKIRCIPREDVNDLFPVNRPIPERLLDGVHKLLDAHSYAYSSPRSPSKEAMASARVESVLSLTVKVLKIDLQLLRRITRSIHWQL